MFVVAIYSSSHDIKLTYATEAIFGPDRVILLETCVKILNW